MYLQIILLDLIHLLMYVQFYIYIFHIFINNSNWRTNETGKSKSFCYFFTLLSPKLICFYNRLYFHCYFVYHFYNTYLLNIISLICCFKITPLFTTIVYFNLYTPKTIKLHNFKLLPLFIRFS